MESVVKYKSRISLIIWPITWLVLLVIFYRTTSLVSENADPYIIGLLAIIWIPTYSFGIIMMLGIRYIFNGDVLVIKVGPFTEREIPVTEIWSLERSFNVMSAPANSLKRLQINYRIGQVLISPYKEKEFLRELKRRNSSIKVIELEY